MSGGGVARLAGRLLGARLLAATQQQVRQAP
jgi:hypothetical protein